MICQEMREPQEREKRKQSVLFKGMHAGSSDPGPRLTSEQDQIGSINVLASLPGCDHCPVVFYHVLQSEGSCVNGLTVINGEPGTWAIIW